MYYTSVSWPLPRIPWTLIMLCLLCASHMGYMAPLVLLTCAASLPTIQCVALAYSDLSCSPLVSQGPYFRILVRCLSRVTSLRLSFCVFMLYQQHLKFHFTVSPCLSLFNMLGSLEDNRQWSEKGENDTLKHFLKIKLCLYYDSWYFLSRWNHKIKKSINVLLTTKQVNINSTAL